MQLASFSLAEVAYAAGDMSYLVQEQAKSASFRVKARQENVSGVTLPAFEVQRVAGSGAFVLISLSRNSADPLWQTSTSLGLGEVGNKSHAQEMYMARQLRRSSSSHRCRLRSQSLTRSSALQTGA